MGDGSPDRAPTVKLPYLGLEVPVVYAPGGQPMLPLHALCEQLGLNWTYEAQRVNRLILWYSACLLPLPYPDEPPGPDAAAVRPLRMAWCLAYPVDVGYWLGQVYGRLRDPALKPLLLKFIHDSDRLGGEWREAMQVRFEAGRKRMRRLPVHFTTLEDLIRQFQEMAARRLPPARQEQLGQLALREQALRDQAQVFLRQWFAYAEMLPMVEDVTADDTSHVIGDSRAFSLFGSFTEAESAQLLGYEESLLSLYREIHHLTRYLDT